MRNARTWWVNFDPSQGGEIRKRRPAIIVSNNIANQYLNRVQVVPLTSNTSRFYPSDAKVIAGGKVGKAVADQLTTVSKKRLSSCLGHITKHEMQEVEKAIRVQLNLT